MKAIVGLLASAALATVGYSGQARADIRVGAILSLTGPAASLGIPARNTIAVWPQEIAGQKVVMNVLDDGSDPTASTVAARKLSSEQNVDVFVGPSVTPTSMAAMQVAAETSTPMLSLAGGGALVTPMDDVRRWIYKMPPSEAIPLKMIFQDMKQRHQNKLAIVAMSNAYGQTFVDVANKLAASEGINIVAVERFSGTDTSFVSQAIKLLGVKPDAVLIAAAGTPAAMPQLELAKRNYKGQIYQTQAVANNDFLRVGGQALEGTRMPVSPLLVAEQLPDSNPVKSVALRYVAAYKAKYGNEQPSLFGGMAWDAFLQLEHAVPIALKKANPGTPEFRKALRQALEDIHELVLTQGVYTMSPTDHNGADERSQVMVEIKDGAWRYVK